MDIHTERRRHSAAHVLALAAQRLFPNVRLGIGPVTQQGFYHDFEFPRALEWDDIKNLESEMNLIIQEDLPFNRVMVDRDQAFGILMTRGQIFKSELLQDIPDEEISFYKTGEEFIDLCRGPHVESTNAVGVIKLLEVTEVHWRNEPSRPTLQRISGVVFSTPNELTQFVSRLNAIQSRDFRRYAEDLELVSGEDQYQSYTPAGTVTLKVFESTIANSLTGLGYKPMILGAADSLNEMELRIDEYFASKNRSYRSLPLRVYATADARLNRLENQVRIAGKQVHTAHYLMGKSYFSEQSVPTELRTSIIAALDVFAQLDLKPIAHLSASNQEMFGFKLIAELLSQRGVSQTQIINANNRPNSLSLKLVVQDSLKRDWEIMTLDYAAESLDYVTQEGTFAAAHSLTVSSMIDGILAFYLEEMEGGLPFWASPVQATLIPITENQEFYASQLSALLTKHGIRAEMDNRAETMQARIREAELNKTPIIMIVGEKEEAARAVSVRLRNRQELGLIGEDVLLETLEAVIFGKQDV